MKVKNLINVLFIAGSALFLASCSNDISFSISSLNDEATIKGPTNAKEGEEVTFSIDSGTEAVRDVKVNETSLTPDLEGNFSFVMPKGNAYISYVLDPKGYDVNFYNFDNSLLKSVKVMRGQKAEYGPVAPTHPDTIQANYTFEGWDKPLDNVQRDLDVYAKYKTESLSDFVFELNEEGTEYSLNYCGSKEESITVPSTYLGLPVTSIGDNAFVSSTSKYVTIPSGITSIGKEAFYENKSVVEIKGMEGVTDIGEDAFGYTDSLTSVTLPNTLDNLGTRAFEYSGIKEVALPDELASKPSYLFKGAKIEKVHLPDKWGEIPDALFYDCASLTEFNWPTGTSAIGNNAFDGASAIKTLTVPNTVTSIGWYGFGEMTSLTSIDLSSCTLIENVKQYLFYKDTSLTDVKLPPNLKDAVRNLFEKCSSLKTVELPKTLTKIDGFFLDCTSLESVSIPDSVTLITSGSFKNCISLKEVSIPVSITSIDGIFDSDTKVTIHYGGTEEQWNKVSGFDSYAGAKVDFTKASN